MLAEPVAVEAVGAAAGLHRTQYYDCQGKYQYGNYDTLYDHQQILTEADVFIVVVIVVIVVIIFIIFVIIVIVFIVTSWLVVFTD